MHIKSIHLKEFRGFTDLTIADIPATARLVMLIGPNGTGKSSIFDALLAWSGAQGVGYSWDEAFHIKQSSPNRNYGWNQIIERIDLHEGNPKDTDGWKRLCYFRTAYRNEAELKTGKWGVLSDPAERPFHRTIDNDAAISANYRRLVMQTIRDVWGTGTNKHISLSEYADSVVKKVNDSLAQVMPHMKLESLGDPASDKANFYFTKGISRNYL